MSTDETNELETVARLAEQAQAAEVLTPGGIYAFRLGDRVHQIDLTGDEYLDQPRRKRGTVTVRDVASFVAYWTKHSDDNSEVFAGRDARTITAILDANTADTARWGKHRVVLQLVHSESFQAWSGASSRQMSQVAFAEFIEDHRADITTPPAADLLELAQSFQATTKVTFRSGTRLKSGQRQLTYVEEQNASGGSGDLTIPDSFELALPVFDGAIVADHVTARLRYRINDGKLAMYFILDEMPRVIDAAFEGVVADVEAAGITPVLRGTPA